MQREVRPCPRRVRGTLSVSTNKSISHRAAIFNAIALGDAVVEGFQRGADCVATLRCLRQLGTDWAWRDAETLVVHGRGRHGLHEPSGALDCRNSGTTVRLMAGLLAAQPFFSVLTGDASLRSRPMARVIDPLRMMGARIAGRDGNRLAPLAISGDSLHGIRYQMPVASGQVKSAVLLAGLYADGETIVEEPGPTRDHTERMLRAMGADVAFGEGPVISIRPLSSELSPLSMRVPGDISSAAPWLVLAAAHPDAEVRITAVGVNPTRTGILDALSMMGADVRLEEERMWGPEPVADIVVRSSRLRGVTIDGALVPRAIDELPLIALAACFAEGETIIREAEELVVKESNRVRTTVDGLRRMGAEIEALPDGLRVSGPQRLHGAVVSSHGDHRLAMLLGVAGALAEGETLVRKTESV
ncbi:MAG TPA: 3-phosphoshikimate 1-carboxyvinyltransferase, partial [Gemmatimonadales bacterium]|nr:3-phosphoshikimate 1-carboxyvinyltransferase [Gemmatimonadales bacterium]